MHTYRASMWQSSKGAWRNTCRFAHRESSKPSCSKYLPTPVESL